MAALAELRRDFQDRCAYSMAHADSSGGLICMEVDHFDPRRKGDETQDYGNLFLASRHCNGSKREYWPGEADLAAGIRLLNPCEEPDYDRHLFEDAKTGKLVATSPAGVTQIFRLGLNAPHLMRERQRRTQLLATLAEIKEKIAGQGGDLSQVRLVESRFMSVSIPVIMQPADWNSVIPKPF